MSGGLQGLSPLLNQELLVETADFWAGVQKEDVGCSGKRQNSREQAGGNGNESETLEELRRVHGLDGTPCF